MQSWLTQDTSSNPYIVRNNMKRSLIQIFTISILTSCQSETLKQEQKLSVIKKSDCNLTNNKTYNIDSIIQGQRQELENANIKESFNNLINQKIQFLNLGNDIDSIFFPNAKVDSVVYIAYHQYDDKKRNFELKDRQLKFETILCAEKIQALINLVNDPNNFGYAECGTQIPESHILFFNTGKQVAKITFACGLGQLNCEPKNILINFGGLNENGNKTLNEIAPWR